MYEKLAPKYNGQACFNCLYYINGECRRYPPVPHATNYPNRGLVIDLITPQVEDDYWCGEWKANE